jgi:predicted RNA-binding Zn ribbon-like protein
VDFRAPLSKDAHGRFPRETWYTSKTNINGIVKARQQRDAALKFSIETIRLDGGRPCLDFVNTIHDRFAAAPLDYLATPQHYKQWCLRTQLLSRPEAERIDVALSILGEARSYREHLHAMLSAVIDGEAVPAKSLRECDRLLHQAWSALSLHPGSPGGVCWPPGTLDARLPLKRIALSALDVLRTAQPHRLKRCASADSCGWFFYDDSKGGRRRWCAMEACGTVDKMRRYRRR